jgi:branched-chain amino acid aminotransferase
MLSIEWTAADGWLAPRITPYQNLSLDPASCVFHYAFECFEGMKAYKDKNGTTRLFRPEKNMERLNKSSSRIALPPVDEKALVKLIGEFVKLDSRFIPKYAQDVHLFTCRISRLTEAAVPAVTRYT